MQRRILAISAIFLLLSTTFAQDQCQVGTCTLIEQCPKLYELLQKEPKDQAEVDLLKNRFCGYDNRWPRVCCTYREKSYRRTTGTEINNGNSRVDDPFEAARRLLPSNCGQDLSNRIIGGTATELDEYPWLVLLEYREGRVKSTACGGSLISKRYVLTAAHCVSSPPLPATMKLTSVRLGEYDTASEIDCLPDGNDEQLCADRPISVGIERSIVHESYNAKQQNDIALLRLVRDVQFTGYIKPLCLPAGPQANKRLVVSGWGQTETRSSSNVKLKVSLPLVERSKCTELNPKVPLIESQICVGGKQGTDSCHGDSGGPLMQQTLRPDDNVYRWEAVGVVSYGISFTGLPHCGVAGKPAVYTNVSYHMPWILSKIQA